MQPLFVHHPAPTGKNNGSNARRLSIHVLIHEPPAPARLLMPFRGHGDPATSMLARAWVRCTLSERPFGFLDLPPSFEGR